MVEVTSQDELSTRDVPVRLTPTPPGRWRWIGTKTLLFEPTDRFPMATEYEAEIPAGVKSATGAVLASPVNWKFQTPPPQLRTAYPSGSPFVRNPVMFASFDQRIDPASVVETIRIRSEAGSYRVRLATPEEIKSNERVSELVDAAEKDRWLAFRVVAPAGSDSKTPLPADSDITVTIGPDTPSAEGPRKTDKAQEFTFHTYGPFYVVRQSCGNSGECRPLMPFSINFSNPLDTEAFQQSQVRVEPELPGMKSQVYGNTLFIRGLTRGQTTYKVTLDRAIGDLFGQTLEEDKTISLDVQSAYPRLTSAKQSFVILDPNGPPRYSVFTVNYKSFQVHLYAVGPEHWQQFTTNLYNLRGRNAISMPGRLILTKDIAVEAKPDEMVETPIDLSPALKDGLGQVIVVVEPVEGQPGRGQISVTAWVQATRIGLTAFSDDTDLRAWATSLKDGKPIDGVQVFTQNAGESSAVSTGVDGMARLALKAQKGPGPDLLIARKGEDLAILPERAYWAGNDWEWYRKEPADSRLWYVFSDRGVYRPGEEVHIKGWIRRMVESKTEEVGLLRNVSKKITYTLKDSRENELLKGTLSLNALDGFDTSFKLPKTMNLGYAYILFEAEGVNVSGRGGVFPYAFQVQEFRRPEYEVTTSASEGPYFVGGNAQVTVKAAYYAGGGLPDADVEWLVTSATTQYIPPNRGDFTFGKWAPWWFDRPADSNHHIEAFAAKTDATGKHNLRIDFDSVNPALPSTVTAEARVTDVNRQTWSASSTMLVHPADLYVGIKSARTFVQKGEPLIIQAIATDLDGNLVPGRAIQMRAVQLDWTYENGEWHEKEVDAQECSITSANAPVQCTFETKAGGRYRVTATVRDDRERANESELSLWVAGGKLPPKRDVAEERIELIPDRKEYKSGDTAEILVQAPFYPAEGVMTLRRSGIVSSERFTMDGPSYTLKIPITDEYVPNLYVWVDIVGETVRTDDEGRPLDNLPKRPAFAAGDLNLSIPPLERTLAVTATPRDKALEPGGETVVDVELKDASGAPVSGGELAVVVVDEAILALTDYHLADPVAAFYPKHPPGANTYQMRKDVLLASAATLIGKSNNNSSEGVFAGAFDLERGGGGGRSYSPQMAVAMEMKAPAAASVQPAQIRVRADFNALATFAATVPTDALGRASVKVKLPDNLTRYRVMAVAVSGEKYFGQGESAITARLPLMARPSAPRFLNFGDRFELPVAIQNQTDTPMDVEVAVRATNASLIEGAGRRVRVPANDRLEVRFPATTASPGTARFQIAAASGRWADAAEVELPVWTPATTEAFATYGEIDRGAVFQPVKAPSGVVNQFGGLEVTTSSTQLRALTDAVLYLTAYPFECSEQLSSRVLAVAALKDVLTAFEARGLPAPKEMVSAVARDIKRLEALQNDDGGFPFWKRGDPSWPYVSIHVAHALERAKEKGFEVPPSMLEKSKSYLREIENRLPDYYGPETRRTLTAYALYTRNRMGDRDAARARRLIAEAGLDKLSLEAVGWLLPVLSGDAASSAEVAAIRKHLNNRAEETAGTAHFTTSYSDGGYLLLHSSRRADGIILEALIGDQPANDLIPKIVRGLLAHRTKGRWENTQENAFILLALDKYFAAYEKVTPDFVARAWLGDRLAGDHEFRGRTTERFHLEIPMRYLTESNDAQNLILNKEGPGRLYYRVGIRYAPESLMLAAADYGFTVERTYEAVDDAGDVTRDSSGVWHIRAGAKVRVRLTMMTPARRYHVALTDPLPAGLEPLNPSLATTGSIPQDPKDESSKGRWWWSRTWFEHQNMRDERVEAFASLLWEGVHNYSYVTRATTPGNFIVPPPKAEEMYHPETFGRGATDRVVVE